MARLLVIDDEEMNRDIFGTCGKEAGFMVELATGGHQALELLKDNQYEVAIIDLNMPEIDGVEILKTIASDEQHTDMIKMVITANPHMSNAESVQGLADHIMFKPIQISQLIAFLQRFNPDLKE